MSATNIASGQKGFLRFIAYLQVIGIILVVFGHSFHEYPDGSHGTAMLIYRMFYNFRMPLFLFVSGFLMLYTTFKRTDNPPTIRAFTFKKLKRLLIPYLVLTIVTYFPRASMSGIADDSLPLSAKGMLGSLYLTDHLPIPYFWFIQTSIILLIFSYAIISVCRKYNVRTGTALAIIILLWMGAQFIEWGTSEIFGYRHAIYYGIYFILGGVYCEFFETVNRYLPLDTLMAFVISFVIWITSFMFWEETDLSRLSSLFGIAMCVSLAKLLVKYNMRFLDHLVGANYIIFLLSWYFNVLTQQVLSHFIDLPWWIHTMLSLTFGIYVPWLGYRYLQNHKTKRTTKILAFMLGQSLK